MHVTLLGSGALGLVYGVRLAQRERVSFVVRHARADDTSPYTIQRNGDRTPTVVRDPARVESVPQDTEVVLLAIRTDQLDASVRDLLDRGPDVPVVSLTPLFPDELDQTRAWLGPRLVPALPSLASHVEDGVVRYWLSRVPPTLIDEEGASHPAVRVLVSSLGVAGIPARFAPDVAARNLALTAAFLPSVLLLHASGGSVERATGSKKLLRSAARALRASARVASALGPLPTGMRTLARAATPSTIRAATWTGERVRPELMRYLEGHFGDKTRAQNLLMARQLVSMGEQDNVDMQPVRELIRECEERDATRSDQT